MRYVKDTNFIDFRKLKEELPKDSVPRLFSPDDKMREFRFK